MMVLVYSVGYVQVISIAPVTPPIHLFFSTSIDLLTDEGTEEWMNLLLAWGSSMRSHEYLID